MVSKVLEGIQLDCLCEYMGIINSQFGFKAKPGTDLCIYALKEEAEIYRGQNSSVLIGFIDAFKAF